jgi:hypothetical protein
MYPITDYISPPYPTTVYISPPYPTTVYIRPPYPTTVYISPPYPTTVYIRPPYPTTVYISPLYPITVYIRHLYFQDFLEEEEGTGKHSSGHDATTDDEDLLDGPSGDDREGTGSGGFEGRSYNVDLRRF